MKYFIVFFTAFFPCIGSFLTSYKAGIIMEKSLFKLLSLHISEACSISTFLKEWFFLLCDLILLLVNIRIPSSLLLYIWFYLSLQDIVF